MKKLYILGAVVVGLAACKPNIEPKAPERGDADFSRYMAVGSAHTAGVMSGALYREGQLNSYPYILSMQLQTVGGGDFKQPLVTGEHGWPLGKKVIDYYQGPCDTLPYITVVPFKGALDTAGTGTNIYSTGPFHNMGIPAAKVTDYIVPGFAMQNRYAYRMFNKPTTARALEELQNIQATFFTCWLGLDDVMDYAMAGGEVPGAPIGHRAAITDPYTFEFAYDSVINVMTRNGAKGVLLNLPNILDMPYFNTVMPRSLELTIKTANELNLQYNGTQVHFDVGMNYFVVEDASNVNGFRQIKEGEKIRMDVPQDSIRCNGWGSYVPMPARYVITADEVAKIETALMAYNGIIQNIALNYSLAMTDVKTLMNEVKTNGMSYNGVSFTNDLMMGGFFSLDGVTLTGRGNALLTNRIINTINTYYKSSIADADVNAYSSIRRP